MPGMQESISVVIVDDEEEACINLRNILNEYIGNGISIAGVAVNTKEAEKIIAHTRPDAVFLDIEMPHENAFAFLERVSPVNFEVVFVTAYDEYAVKAFKQNAVDYILKPISIAELGQAVQKLKEKIALKKAFNTGSAEYGELSGQITNKVKSQRITLKDGNVIEVVDFKDILFIEAQGSYFRVVFLKDNAAREIVMCGSLTDYEELLPSDLFFRVHKSYIINCRHLKKILKDDHSQVIINNNHTLPVSRRRYAPLIDFLKSNNYYNE